MGRDSKEWRQKRRAAGFCLHCGGQRTGSNKTFCESCVIKRRNYYRSRKTPKQPVFVKIGDFRQCRKCLEWFSLSEIGKYAQCNACRAPRKCFDESTYWADFEDYLRERDDIFPFLENMELRQAIDDLFSSLTEREEKVLRLRFGFDDWHPRTLEEVGSVFNVTRSRIREIEAKALRKMRHITRAIVLEPFLNKPLDKYKNVIYPSPMT